MDPQTILGINKIIQENNPKSFDELRVLINNSPFSAINDQALQAFGIRKEEIAVVEKSTKKPREFAKCNKTILDWYIELVSDVKKLKTVVQNIDSSEAHDDTLQQIDVLVAKHTENIKESDIWK
jgi:hypothetical protein